MMKWFLFGVGYSILCRVYRIKKHKKFTTNHPTRIYINRINNRLIFKIKDEYKIELETPKTMNLFGSTKELIHKKRMEKV